MKLKYSESLQRFTGSVLVFGSFRVLAQGGTVTRGGSTIASWAAETNATWRDFDLGPLLQTTLVTLNEGEGFIDCELPVREIATGQAVPKFATPLQSTGSGRICDDLEYSLFVNGNPQRVGVSAWSGSIGAYSISTPLLEPLPSMCRYGQRLAFAELYSNDNNGAATGALSCADNSWTVFAEGNAVIPAGTVAMQFQFSSAYQAGALGFPNASRFYLMLGQVETGYGPTVAELTTLVAVDAVGVIALGPINVPQSAILGLNAIYLDVELHVRTTAFLKKEWLPGVFVSDHLSLPSSFLAQYGASNVTF